MFKFIISTQLHPSWTQWFCEKGSCVFPCAGIHQRQWKSKAFFSESSSRAELQLTRFGSPWTIALLRSQGEIQCIRSARYVETTMSIQRFGKRNARDWGKNFTEIYLSFAWIGDMRALAYCFLIAPFRKPSLMLMQGEARQVSRKHQEASYTLALGPAPSLLRFTVSLAYRLQTPRTKTLSWCPLSSIDDWRMTRWFFRQPQSALAFC